jgi:glucosamine--fructose-6-phosphate aminotransferase (isomerizing)
MIGMGSSRFAAVPVAARLRARGVDAVAEYASSTVVQPGRPGTLAIGVSAGGATPETVEALARHRAAGSVTVAVTNADAAPLVEALAS